MPTRRKLTAKPAIDDQRALRGNDRFYLRDLHRTRFSCCEGRQFNHEKHAFGPLFR